MELPYRACGHRARFWYSNLPKAIDHLRCGLVWAFAFHGERQRPLPCPSDSWGFLHDGAPLQQSYKFSINAYYSPRIANNFDGFVLFFYALFSRMPSLLPNRSRVRWRTTARARSVGQRTSKAGTFPTGSEKSKRLRKTGRTVSVSVASFHITSLNYRQCKELFIRAHKGVWSFPPRCTFYNSERL